MKYLPRLDDEWRPAKPGAKAVEVGTANFLDPAAPIKIIEGLEAYCKRKGILKLSSIIGGLRE